MNIRSRIGVAPDYDNYSLFGKAWKDRLNDVTQMSAKIGSGDRNLSEATERHERQRKLLAARLNTFLDAASTPVTKTMSAIRDLPVLPSFSRARRASLKSFSESKAVSKFKGEYLRCDQTVREEFLAKLAADIVAASNNMLIQGKLKELHAELSGLSGKKLQDLDTLETRKEQLEQRKVDVGGMRGREKLLGQAGLLFSGTSGELRSAQRKINEILKPSSYELHRADNNGDKVSHRPLHVEELKNRRRGLSSSTQGLNTEIEIRNFTEAQFDVLANAIRDFRGQLANGSEAGIGMEVEQALRSASKPILYSGERQAVHRFIKDMVRQLKRAGIAASELDEIRQLIPDEPSSAQALVQGLVPGTGKQMRLQDEAERMAKALPKVLRLADVHGDQLRYNLMQFDLNGVQAFARYVNSHAIYEDSPDAVEFIKTPQGKALVDAIVEKGVEVLGQDNLHVKDLKSWKTRRDPETTLHYARDLLTSIFSKRESTCPDLNHLLVENRHLFMMSSDAEFWEKEAVDKVTTRLTKDEDTNATKKSRIFKQMKLRAAAMNMDEHQIDAYMRQGISDTLRNRNMTIQGTKVAGVIGSVTGNLLSTPLSVAAATKAPIFAAPGLLDLVLMPAGWALGQAPGAIYGKAMLNRMKEDRMREAQDSPHTVRFDPDGTPGTEATYVSATRTLKFSRKTLLKLADRNKPTMTPLVRGNFSQYGHVHGPVWKGIGKEVISLTWTPLRYALYTGPKDAWKDLVLHNDPALSKIREEERRESYSLTFFHHEEGLAPNSPKSLPPLPPGAMTSDPLKDGPTIDWSTMDGEDRSWRQKLYADHPSSDRTR